MTDKHPAIELVPAGELHRGWIFGTLWRSLAETPGWTARNAQHEAAQVLDRLSILRSVVAVPRGYPEELAGWAIGDGEGLLAVYVRYSARRGGIGTVLVHAACDDESSPICYVEHKANGNRVIPVGYWSRAAGRMAANGYPWRHDLDTYERMMGGRE